MPGILNVIFYHGKRAWTGRKAFEERSFKPEVGDKKIMSFLNRIVVGYRVRILDVSQSPEIERFLRKRSQSSTEKKAQWALYVLSRICHLSREEALNAGDDAFLSEALGYLEGLSYKERSALLADLIGYMERYFYVSRGEIEGAIKKTKSYKKEDDMESFLDMYNKDIMKEGMQKGKQAGIKEGMQKGIYKTALRMLDKNLTPSQIAEYTGLSVRQISLLKKSSEK